VLHDALTPCDPSGHPPLDAMTTPGRRAREPCERRPRAIRRSRRRSCPSTSPHRPPRHSKRPIVSAAASDRRGAQAQEQGWGFAQPDAASRPLSVAATASGRMVDAGADEALCKAMAFMRREGARRSTR